MHACLSVDLETKPKAPINVMETTYYSIYLLSPQHFIQSSLLLGGEAGPTIGTKVLFSILQHTYVLKRRQLFLLLSSFEASLGGPSVFTVTGLTFSTPGPQGLFRPPTIYPETVHGAPVEMMPMERITYRLIQLEEIFSCKSIRWLQILTSIVASQLY